MDRAMLAFLPAPLLPTSTPPLSAPRRRPRHPAPQPLRCLSSLRPSSPAASTSAPQPSPALSNAIRTRRTASIAPLLRLYLDSVPASAPLTVWTSAVSACSTARDIDALSACLRAPLISASPIQLQLRVSHFVRPLRTLAQSGAWRHVLLVLHAMRTVGLAITPDLRLLLSLANVAVERRAYDASLALFDFIKTAGLKMEARAYSVLLKSHSRANNLAAVRSVVADIEADSVVVDAVLLNTIVDSFVRCGQLAKAQQILSNLKYRHLIDVATYNTLIKGYVMNSNLETAFRTVEDMTAAGFSPNLITRNTLLAACVHATDYKRAWSLLDSFTLSNQPKFASDTNDSNAGRTGSASSSSSTDQLNNSSVESTSMDKTMSKHQQKQLSIALSSIIAGLASQGRAPDAVHLLNDMFVKHSAPPTSITYAALLTACFRNEDIGIAHYVYRSIPSHLHNITVSNAYICGLCRAGDEKSVEQAAALIEQLLSRKEEESDAESLVDEQTFNGLLQAYVRSNNFEKAEYYLRLMRSENIQPGIVSYTILMNGYANMRKYANAKRVFKQISLQGLKPDRVALNTYLSISARTYNLWAVEKVLSFMERQGGSIAPDAYTFTPLISSFARNRDDTRVWETYNRMRKQGIPVNEYHTRFLMRYIQRQLTDSQWAVSEKLAIAGMQLLNDAYEDGVSVPVLRAHRRKMFALFKDARALKHLRRMDIAALRSASEQIFERHGWNEIDSSWRVL